MPSIDNPLAVIRSVRWPIAGLIILDIGCGSGGLARQLVAEGAKVAGVDPGGRQFERLLRLCRQRNSLKAWQKLCLLTT